ncbi:MAG: hypothetical protein ACREV2_01350 [Burkholderiales bacterium]
MAKAGKKVFIAIVVVVLAAIAWFLASPLFVDRQIAEEFPLVLKQSTDTERTAPGGEEIATMSPEELEELGGAILSHG